MKLKEFLVSEFKVEADLILPEKLLRDDLHMDSLDIADFVLGIEDQIGIKIDPSIFKNANTMQDVIDFIHPLFKTPS
jgi:acyl carrier protein